MHPYSTEHQKEREFMLQILLCVLSIASAYGLYLILENIKLPLWFIEWPSVLGFYALYYKLLDGYFWRTRLFSFFIKAPDVSGKYIGKAKSSHDPSNLVDVSVSIHQTWTQISIILNTPNSKSFSQSASLCEDSDGDWGLTYTYLNKPNNAATSSMNIHEGTARICFSKGVPKEFEYYTGRGRQTHGSITLNKV